MKNKKGFTLVELLAVIVVLALLALLAGNAVGNIITKSKKNAFRTDALTIIKAAEDQFDIDVLEGSTVSKATLNASGTLVLSTSQSAATDSDYIVYTVDDLVSKGILNLKKDYDGILVVKKTSGKFNTMVRLTDGTYGYNDVSSEYITAKAALGDSRTGTFYGPTNANYGKEDFIRSKSTTTNYYTSCPAKETTTN